MRASVLITVAWALLTALPPVVAEEEPDYPHGDFAGDCTDCHSEDGWTPVKIGKDWKHPDAFRLQGAHRTAGCLACHLTLDFSEAASDCVSCHSDVHRGELGLDCAVCHSPRNFLDRSAQLERHRTTRLPLVGAHAAEDCESCHVPQPQGALNWIGTPVDCVACHLADYEGTDDPDHDLSAFPTECQLCHTPTFWERARFDHAGTAFPLTGAHRFVDCQECHSTGYTVTPTDCFACHQEDYANTSEPDHQLSGFPTDCAACHNTQDWGDGDFAQHDSIFFPIFSGRHQGRWDLCSDCHTQPGNFAQFSCFLCHSSNETASNHNGVAGYAYDSQLCYQCHPRGDE